MTCSLTKAPFYNFLTISFDHHLNDFGPVPFRFVYPRRLGKTTMLDFIEAAFSPLPAINGYDSVQLKTKIAGLERGKQLFEFGLHPVLRLDLKGISSIESMTDHIHLQLRQAGLADTSNISEGLGPSFHVEMGARRLNKLFEAETGVCTKTIVLIDNFDHPFRDKTRGKYDPFLEQLVNVFSLGKRSGSGISLLIMCGLTRIVGNNLSGLNNHVDVSARSTYHGLCGISARELVKCANGQLENLAKEKYNGQSFEQVLNCVFVPEWGGFRQGLDDKVMLLDPTLPEGALLSPLDAWELVQSLSQDNPTPTCSRWLAALMKQDDCFEFTSFADRYVQSREGAFQLYRALLGRWVEQANDLYMNRRRYMHLESNVCVTKVLYELGLLTVKEFDGQKIRFGSPNWAVTRSALKLLVKVTKQEATPKSLAREYLTREGFGLIISRAAKQVNDLCQSTMANMLLDFPLEEYLYMELLFRFPDLDDSGHRKNYDLYRKAPVSIIDESNQADNVHKMAVALLYENSETMAFIIETKITKISEDVSDSINAAHQKNVVEAQSCTWQGPAVETEQRVVVSGVWYPTWHPQSGADHFQLSVSYEFLD